MSPPTIESVLEREIEQIETSRNLRLGPDAIPSHAKHSLIGLAFSGGGIRSATFNLGVLQALAKAKILRGFDYLSTVSGGGYIGSWLMAWMHHQEIGIPTIEERLSAPPRSPKESADPPEVHFLRDYSNYLTPRKGILGADFWAFAASYLRNTILNQIILVLAILSLLLVPRTFVYLLHSLENAEELLQSHIPGSLQQYIESQNLALLLGIILGSVAILFMGLNMITVDSHKKRRDFWFANQWAVQSLIIVPLFVSAALFTYGFGQFSSEWGITQHPWLFPPLLGMVMYFGQWAAAMFIRRIAGERIGMLNGDGPMESLVLIAAAFTGAIIGYLFLPYAHILIPLDADDGTAYSKWHVMTFGVPVAILIILLAGVLHIGLMGRGFSDAHREWWARLGGWLLLYAGGWFLLFLIAVYFPAGLGKLLVWEAQKHGHPLTFSGVTLWLASTIYGVLFGKSENTNRLAPSDPIRKTIPAYVAKVTPYVFILGVFLALSLLASLLAALLTGNGVEPLALPDDISFNMGVPLLCGVLFGAALLLSWRVDINEFSTHYLYRNRLVRCYLGATVPNRKAQPFTGFSPADNLPLGALQIPPGSIDARDARPVPIYNTSLNVVRGKELAMQARKARSFAFTPIHAGFTRGVPGERAWDSFYAPTNQCASKMPGFKDGITLGSAVAISGAAASPNMGSYSEPALAFLMTIFDVRLGWWIGNPGRRHWRNGSPNVGFYWLLRELLGSTNDDSEFVYLSDGGHFENLAVYELVRRRCKLIVACDASCDSGYSFGDLFNAVERCRTDFGVDIVMNDLASLRPETDPASPNFGRAGAHYATGKIRYTPDLPGDDGTIVYIKPALVTGDPCDVLAYANTNKSFPHDSTANQFFDEAHFENYRALGEAAGAAATDVIAAEIRSLLYKT
jgi:predicted acylesterase/phospholipase RssA